MVFHHDITSSHTSKQTLKSLKKEIVKCISHEEWMLQSPNADLIDIGTRSLQKLNVNYVKCLQIILIDEWTTTGSKYYEQELNCGQHGVGVFTPVMDFIF
ncbi:hypothetical protein DPMN_157731 [Dreissena polymorpha]|uniref:Uncharacterized protein n=1 Tax=Dreissena polymorpha TaxID=45954 RepID=A0A9D4EGJ5_DREPO|nr:hypothetical protein DPMN_157731 [Dreissena polymorpha]